LSLYDHVPHPWHEQRKQAGPVRSDGARTGLNGRIGLRITTGVGTMVCAYLFCVLALISLPAALTSGSVIVIVSWVAQTFLQLVLLPVIIVGQNIQAAAADKRSEQTYNDAEAVLHEALEIQRHLEAQDQVLAGLILQAQPRSK